MVKNHEMIIEKYKELLSYQKKLDSSAQNFEETFFVFCKANNINIDEERILKDISENKIETIEEDTLVFSETMSKSLKSEYRAVAKETHPDNVKNFFLNSTFVKCSEAYSQENIFEVYRISNTIFGKNVFEITEDDFSYMVKYLDSQINKAKSHNMWSWELKTAHEKAVDIALMLNRLNIKNIWFLLILLTIFLYGL